MWRKLAGITALPGGLITSGGIDIKKKGLEGLKDRSKRPLYSPRATKAEIVEKIVYLRQHYYFGAKKI